MIQSSTCCQIPFLKQSIYYDCDEKGTPPTWDCRPDCEIRGMPEGEIHYPPEVSNALPPFLRIDYVGRQQIIPKNRSDFDAAGMTVEEYEDDLNHCSAQKKDFHSIYWTKTWDSMIDENLNNKEFFEDFKKNLPPEKLQKFEKNVQKRIKNWQPVIKVIKGCGHPEHDTYVDPKEHYKISSKFIKEIEFCQTVARRHYKTKFLNQTEVVKKEVGMRYCQSLLIPMARIPAWYNFRTDQKEIHNTHQKVVLEPKERMISSKSLAIILLISAISITRILPFRSHVSMIALSSASIIASFFYSFMGIGCKKVLENRPDCAQCEIESRKNSHQ